MGEWRPAGDRRTLGDVVVGSAERWGDRLAYVVDDLGITYADSALRSAAVANALRQLGVGRGDRVALLVENCVELVDLFLACGRLGAIEVAINTANRGEFLRHVLQNCDPTVLVIDDAYRDRLLADFVLPNLRAIVVHPTDGPATDGPDLGCEVHTTGELYRGLGEPFGTDDQPDYRDPLMIVYTSGTTGPSKGVVAPHRYVINAASGSFLRRGGEEGDVVYSPLPLYHLNAHIITILGPYLHGATGVLDRHFSVSRFWERVDTYGANHIAILGAQLQLVWDLPPDPRDGQRGLKVLIGAPISAEMAPRWQQRYGLKTSQGYALTEAVPVTSAPAAEAPPGSSGRALDEFEVRLFDDTDEDVPTGEAGEICIRPREPFIMFSGYWRDPQATVDVWRNGWFHTGDLGRFDADGYLYFVDRKKDYLRRGGENVSSFEVERALSAHPDVSQVAAFGVPSELSEEDCMVVVVPVPGREPDPWDLVRFCVDNMPFYAVPRYIQVVDELPHTPTGKVEKYRLREQPVVTGTFDLHAEGYRVSRKGLVPLDAPRASR